MPMPMPTASMYPLPHAAGFDHLQHNPIYNPLDYLTPVSEYGPPHIAPHDYSGQAGDPSILLNSSPYQLYETPPYPYQSQPNSYFPLEQTPPSATAIPPFTARSSYATETIYTPQFAAPPPPTLILPSQTQAQPQLQPQTQAYAVYPPSLSPMNLTSYTPDPQAFPFPTAEIPKPSPPKPPDNFYPSDVSIICLQPPQTATQSPHGVDALTARFGEFILGTEIPAQPARSSPPLHRPSPAKRPRGTSSRSRADDLASLSRIRAEPDGLSDSARKIL